MSLEEAFDGLTMPIPGNGAKRTTDILTNLPHGHVKFNLTAKLLY